MLVGILRAVFARAIESIEVEAADRVREFYGRLGVKLRFKRFSLPRGLELEAYVVRDDDTTATGVIDENARSSSL